MVRGDKRPQADVDSNRLFFFSLALVLLAVVPYLQTFGHGFLRFDDGVYVYENPQVQQALTLNNVVWAFGGITTAGMPFDEGYNIYWSSSGSPYLDFALSPTSRIADPRFVNPGLDFHLLPDSPALAAGTQESIDAGWSIDLDGAVLGHTRPITIGVYNNGL